MFRDYAANNGIPFDRRNLEITQIKNEEHEDEIYHTEQQKEMEQINEYLNLHSFFNDKDFDYIKSVIQSTIVHLKKQNQINSVQLQFLMSLNFQELLKHHGNVFTEVHDTLDKIKSEKLQRKKT